MVVTSLTLLCILDWSIVLHDFEDKDLLTMFENHPIMSLLKFSILAFSTNFCPIKSCISGNTVWKVASGFQKLAKIDYFLTFSKDFLSTQNINVARFARTFECDYLGDFQSLYLLFKYSSKAKKDGLFRWTTIWFPRNDLQWAEPPPTNAGTWWAKKFFSCRDFCFRDLTCAFNSSQPFLSFLSSSWA